MKTKTQNQRLIAYLRKHRKGITTMEAFQHLGICRLSERIREIEGALIVAPNGRAVEWVTITRTRELAPNGSTVTRYKLAR